MILSDTRLEDVYLALRDLEEIVKLLNEPRLEYYSWTNSSKNYIIYETPQ